MQVARTDLTGSTGPVYSFGEANLGVVVHSGAYYSNREKASIFSVAEFNRTSRFDYIE